MITHSSPETVKAVYLFLFIQQYLYFLPLPHGHGSFRPIFLPTILEMTGFLDGINDSLKEPNPIETMEEDTVVSLAFDKVKL